MPTPPMPLAQGHHTPAALSPGEAWEGRMSLAGSPTQRGRSGGRGAGALGGLEGRGSHGAPLQDSMCPPGALRWALMPSSGHPG